VAGTGAVTLIQVSGTDIWQTFHGSVQSIARERRGASIKTRTTNIRSIFIIELRKGDRHL
jgi:hypothetical protein